MKIFNGLEEYNLFKKPVVTIGTFDGVHLGHRQIILQLKKTAKGIGGETLVLTFWPHPRHVIDPHEDKLSLLNTLEDKISIFESLGVENLLIIPFTEEFSKQPPNVFINSLVTGKLNAKVIVIGYDHRFGKGRMGSYSYLKENSRLFDYDLIEVPPFEIDGLNVSSTKIRNFLLSGDINFANKLLGYNYYLRGKVIKGKDLGKSFDFPTANIMINSKLKLIPFDGVYVCKVSIENEEFFGMVNIGENPTIPEKGRSIEVNIFDFEKDIYGENIKVEFLERLRDEIKFDNKDLLKKQIQKDKKRSIKYIREYCK